MTGPGVPAGSKDEFAYAGGELDLFAEAHTWKRYAASVMAPHLRGSVLEVGAGLGGTTPVLLQCPQVTALTALEPDPLLLERLRQSLALLRTRPGIQVEARSGTLATLGPDQRFDSVVYMDVLEHIEDDRAELERAAAHVVKGGRVVVLSPAHPWLYSPFDRQVGHFRRYTRRSLGALQPVHTRLVALRYLDSVGLVASVGGRILGQKLPTARQIALWDGVMVPASRVLDRLTRGRLGKSVLGVWEVLP